MAASRMDPNADPKRSESRYKQKKLGSNGGKLPPPGWEDRFFRVFEKTHLVSEAIKACPCSLSFIYKVRKRDPAFAERWREIEAKSTEVLEQIAMKRAAEGSDTLMIFLLKARKPQMYRENIKHDHEHSHTVGGQISVLAGHQPIEIEASARRQAAALLMAGVTDVSIAEDIADAEVVEDGDENF